MSHDITKQTKSVCAKRRLRSAWASVQSAQSSLCALWVTKDPSFLHVDSEDSDQTGHTLILLVLSCRISNAGKPWYHKRPKNQASKTINVIILKFDPGDSTIQYCVQKTLKE